ncbi:MAG: 50S ribosomal protein L10 [Clostridia bacterium]
MLYLASEKILEQKKQEVSELVELLKNSKSVVISEYQGITVDKDTKMRKELREAGVHYKVVKNAILAHAFEQLGFKGFEEDLKGPNAIAFSEDPVAPSKLMFKYQKEIDKIKIKSGILEGSKIDVSHVERLATLPSKEELIAKVVGGFSAPLYGLVNVLNGNLRGLVVALNAILEKRQEAQA